LHHINNFHYSNDINNNDDANKNNNNNQPNVAVVNLSDYNLTETQINLLSKGLNFCPTPSAVDLSTARQDLDKFHRSLRLFCHFSKQNAPLDQSSNSTATNHTIPIAPTDLETDKFTRTFRKKSTWTPMGPIPLESIITLNEIHLSNLEIESTQKDNLTPKERLALTELLKLSNVVIKPADKGSAVVLMNKSDYVSEAEKQLSDTKFYIQQDTDLTTYHMTEVKKVITDMFRFKYIDEKCKEYLSDFLVKTARFYMLPKIHKNILPPPGRPIISANNCPTEKISQYVDFFLNPLVPKTRSYVKDTTDFVSKIFTLDQVPQNTILVTLDVSSLYTNIPNNEGIRASVKALIESRSAQSVPPTPYLVQLLKMVLTMNNFDFNGKHYLQVCGTAMGTRLAPSYANLCMADFEEKFVYTHHPKPFWWKRYIDDIFMLWTEGEDELSIFLDYLNQCHETIKFTKHVSKTQVNFLDTWVKITEDHKIITDLYEKPTDSHNYLHFDSCHPRHTKTSLPYSQFLRIKRICTHDHDFISHSTAIFQHFLRRGYPPDILSQSLEEVSKLDRSQLLQPKLPPIATENDQPFFAITTFHPQGNLVQQVISSSWDLLSRSCATRPIHDNRVIFGYRRNKNLRDLLVKSSLPEEQEASIPLARTTNQCSNKKCRYCPKINTSGSITSSTTNLKFHTMENVTCKSHNLIYCITCKNCKKQYVGQTKRRLQERFQNHFYNVSKGIEQIGRHFNSLNHNGIEDIEIHILSFIKQPSNSPTATIARNKVEMAWIYRLNTVAPLGLNILD